MIYSRSNKLNTRKIWKEVTGSKEFKQALRKKKYAQKYTEEEILLFFDQCIRSIPRDYLNFLSHRDLIHFVLRRHDFILSSEKIDTVEPSIRISVKQSPDEEWIVNAHIVELLIHDMPFIKNSLVEMFQRIGFSIRYLVSDVYQIEGSSEDGGGRRFSLENKGQKNFYAFFILDKIENFSSQNISQEIIALLKHVYFVTKDFQSMVETVSVVDTGLKNKKVEDFFKWLCRDNFIFFSCSNGREDLGLFRDDIYRNKMKKYLSDSAAPGAAAAARMNLVKTELISNINRRENIILLRFRDMIITGIFTRKADNTPSSAIPIIAEKLDAVIHTNRHVWTTMDKRDFTYAFDLLPALYRFTIPAEGYIDFSELLFQARLTIENKIRLRSFKKGQYFLAIIWPLEDLSESFQARVADYLSKSKLEIRGKVDRALSSVVYFFYELHLKSGSIPENEYDKFEQDLTRSLLSWEKALHIEAEKHFTFEKYQGFKKILKAVIGSDYGEKNSPGDALADVESISAVLGLDRLLKGRYDGKSNKTDLKIFSRVEYSLSYFIPIFSAMDLNVDDEQSYRFDISSDRVYLYTFHIQSNHDSLKDGESLKRICEMIDRIMDQKASSEPMNSLVLTTKLSVYQIELLKALVSYLLQVKKGYSRVLLKKVLQNNPGLSSAIVSMFELRILDIIHGNGELNSQCEDVIRRNIKDYPANHGKLVEYRKSRLLEIENVQVKNMIQAELYKNLGIIINAVVRTNYFSDQETLAFKIQSSLVEFMPQPFPLFEIWVYHAHFEAIHLRGGMVSRGGIRWSDRQDDFRTEVLGLWKTQVLKNTIIVPTGAKGGFVLKYVPNTPDNAVRMYKKFILALLALTDNRIHDRNIKNKKIPILDNEDAYLVVAADKGTASFSDYANEISVESDFWLGDAFASGGKNGYSHKALGITALGAWESARWHLRRLDKDPFKDEISVVGIGDMSGDVFGNAMIYSDKLKLTGAFNHKHIFIDPEPDLAASFAERKRLFDTGGDWSKYDTTKISKGGGVFDRDEISIKISPVLKLILGTDLDQASGEEMIRLLLMAPVDMIFNGGIGTYVKSSRETAFDIDDSTNDSVRVNASEVRAAMVVEGGNLGVSPLGRIEYALGGGLINTDAIDNSAGVDLSDHEVNLKILFKIFLEHGLIKTPLERNRRLKKLAPEEVALVLQNNFIQNWALVYLQSLPPAEMEYVGEFIEMLKSENLWFERGENLHDHQVITECLKAGKPLPSPVLAILHSLGKIYLNRIFSVEKISQLYLDELEKYFPSSLNKFKYLYLKHALKNDIIKTKVINHMMDLTGFPGIVKSLRYLGLDINRTVEYYFASRKALGIDTLKLKRHLPNPVLRKIPDTSFELMLAIKTRVEKAIFSHMEMAVLFDLNLSQEPHLATLPRIDERYKGSLKKEIDERLTKEESSEFLQLINVEFRFALTYLANKKGRHDFTPVFDLFYNFGLLQLKKELYRIRPANRWEIQSQLGLKKIFWDGLINGNANHLKELAVKVQLADEISKLKAENNANLSTLGGIINYLFT